ncbi:MAG TPA: preprotein translocase subunit SecG [Pyrinomonadaceae bacterium]|nr:preprotein translocase subunit SecG [Pyrinomonadaceae bacterium]
MTYILYAFFILACMVLILAVLLQPGKADAGALFTSSVSSTAFGPRGTQTLLAKITIGAAIAFMLTALTLSLGVGGSRSVLESVPEETSAPLPAASPATTPEGGASPAVSPQTQGAAADSSPATSATATSSPQAEASPSPQNP